MSNDGHCFPELGRNLNLGKRMDKIEHEEIVSQDADDNADQKAKWFLKAENIHTFVGSIFSVIFSRKFLFTFTFYNYFDFYPLKMRVKLRN